MNVLLIGSGGREHALAWKLAQSSQLDVLYAAPGNPGIAECATLVSLDTENYEAVIDFCKEADIGLVVVGPEGPLVAGIADALTEAGIRVFGPSAKAPRSWKAPKASPRTCAPSSTSPPPPTAASTMRRAPRLTPRKSARPSSSRPTASRQARASSWR